MTKFSLKEAYEPVRLSREEKDALLETILARSSGETPAGKEGTSMRRNPKHPLLIAAVIAGVLCLVGCAAVYVLTMEDFKVGQREVTQEVWDENLELQGYETVTEQVLTFAGLKDTPAYQAAKEWYEFAESYDPDHAIYYANKDDPMEFPAEYDAYNLYSQEMKDKVDEIAGKYNLKLAGASVENRSEKALLRYLGLENGIGNPEVGASIDSFASGYYENGGLRFYFHMELPEEAVWPYSILGTYTYSPKDCFTTNYCSLNDTGDWKEWNYTTAGGDQVLILRSPTHGRVWIFSDQAEGTVAVSLDAGMEEYSDEDVTKTFMTDRQLEQAVDAIDFSVQVNPGEESLLLGNENVDTAQRKQTQNGVTLELKSAETDGTMIRVVVGITAPEGVILTRVGNETIMIMPGNWEGMNDLVCQEELDIYGANGTWSAREDGDGKDNTVDIVMERAYHSEGTEPVITSDQHWNVYIEDLKAEYWDQETGKQVVQWEAEGVWSFDLSFQDSDFREMEFVSEPVTFRTVVGWKADGTDVYGEVGLTSLVLRSFGASYSFREGETGADMADYKNGIYPTAVLTDGREIPLVPDGGWHLTAEETIPMDQVDHVRLMDGTELKPVTE